MWMIIFVLQALLFSTAMGQFKIQIQVTAMSTPKAYLKEFIGAQDINMIDSVRTDRPGEIRFTLPADAHPGMYRVVMGPQAWLDFIFNREDIVLSTHYKAPVDSLKVIRSQENILWNEYMNHFMILSKKQEGLARLLTLYNPSDPFYKTIEEELTGIAQTDPESVSRRIIQDYPETYVARMLKIEQSPRVPVGLSRDKEINYIIDHFFDDIDFNDSTLIYSPPLIYKVNGFFGLHQQAFPPQELEEALIDGVNGLMSKAAVNDAVFAFLQDQLALMFERSEFETFFAYFTENYLLDASCLDETRNLELAETLEAIKKTTIGNTAPEIIIPSDVGPVILSEMKEPYVLIIFWASWCPHCNEMLPEIKRIYSQYKSKGFEIVAISIDKDPKEYQKALDQGKYPWINYSELKGWDCSIAYDYGIRATPTMILIDQNKKIIGKPRNPEHLRQILSSL